MGDCGLDRLRCLTQRPQDSSSPPCERRLSPLQPRPARIANKALRKGCPSAWRFSSRIAALARRPLGRFADFREIGVHTCLCLKLVGGKGCAASSRHHDVNHRRNARHVGEGVPHRVCRWCRCNQLHILGRLPPLLRPLPHSALESHGRALADSDCNRPSRASRAIPKR